MRRSLPPIVAAAGILLAAAAPASADCGALDGEVKAAIRAGDARLLPDLADRISREPSCDSTYVEKARRSMALAILMAGQRDDGSYEPEYVIGAASIARPWQISMAFGDLKYDERAYREATEAYEAAINEIRNVRIVPKAPPREVEEYLAKRAYQAKSLAPTYVSSRGFRGEPAGVILPAFRNFTAVSVPVPIRFATDEATLTPDGEKAVDDLYAFFQAQGVKSIVLVGHTDERGSDGHNNALSTARARAVADALRGRGLDCDIKAEGMGKRSPFDADDRSRYAEEERYAFDRRVEFKILE
jgi:outer membrane protein OmpA-like peptidoglycan-associated protein